MTFEEAWVIASKVDGPLGIGEAKELWRVAQTTSGDVVDAGCGIRTCLLLAATGPVTSAIPLDEFDEVSYTKWRDAIVDSGVAANVFVAEKNDMLHHDWEHPVGLLLLNGWDTIHQIQGWKAHLVPGAAVGIFHYGSGVTEDFKREKETGSLTIFRYSPKVTG